MRTGHGNENLSYTTLIEAEEVMDDSNDKDRGQDNPRDKIDQGTAT